MRKRIRLLLGFATAAALVIPAAGSTASAAHYCGLEDVSHTLNTICNNYHDPKAEIAYIACLVTGYCPIS
jgi:hypothetical protein